MPSRHAFHQLEQLFIGWQVSAFWPVLRFRAKFVEPLQPFKPCQLPQPLEDLA
jgi:hypothetical protein